MQSKAGEVELGLFREPARNFFAPATARGMRGREGGMAGRPEPLTPREREVMECLSRRMMDREIAVSLEVSINTVKHHLRNIYSKFGVSGRRRAVESYRVGLSAAGAERT